jgi:hypothetical protein
MGADYTFDVKTIETHACTFLTLNILAIGRVEDSTLSTSNTLPASTAGRVDFYSSLPIIEG